MKQHFSKLGKQTLVYGISGTALQAVGLLTLPIFARVFSPTEYGVLELVTVGMAATMLFADLSLRSASQRSFFDYAGHEDAERRSVVCTALDGVASDVRDRRLAWLSWPVIRSQKGFSKTRSTRPCSCSRRCRSPWPFWRTCCVTSCVCISVRGITPHRPRSERLLWAGSALALVLWTDAGVDGVLIGVVVGNAVAAVYGIAVIGSDAIGRLSWSELKTMLAFGLPLIPAAAALWGVAFLDRVMLSQIGDLADVGEYAIAARFATVVMLGVTAFGLAFSPFLLSLWSEDPETERQVRARTLTYLTVVLAGLSLVLGLFAREMILVVAPDFEEAYELVGVLCMGVTVFGIANVATAGMVLARRTRAAGCVLHWAHLSRTSFWRSCSYLLSGAWGPPLPPWAATACSPWVTTCTVSGCIQRPIDPGRRWLRWRPQRCYFHLGCSRSARRRWPSSWRRSPPS